MVLLAVGLYLLDRWWSAEDILKTADSSRTGLIKVTAIYCHFGIICNPNDQLLKNKGNVERIFLSFNLQVRTTGERIVLYVLNRIIYRTKEIAGNDAPFLCHGEDEIAKILWKNGEAIGFYSVKPEGMICLSICLSCKYSVYNKSYRLKCLDTNYMQQI